MRCRRTAAACIATLISLLVSVPFGASVATAAPGHTVVISISDGTLDVITSDPSTATTRIEIAVYDYAGDSDSGPSPTGIATGQTCTITPPASPSSPWSGSCSIPGASARTWLAVKATAYVGSTPGSPVDSNQVYWAGPWESGVASGPSDILQAVRQTASGGCSVIADSPFGYGTGLVGGWSSSWAEWANGPVCVRTLSLTENGWRLR